MFAYRITVRCMCHMNKQGVSHASPDKVDSCLILSSIRGTTRLYETPLASDPVTNDAHPNLANDDAADLQVVYALRPRL